MPLLLLSDSHARAAIDQYLLPTGPICKPAAVACGSQMGQMDGQTDTLQLYRPCSVHYVGSANEYANSQINEKQLTSYTASIASMVHTLPTAGTVWDFSNNNRNKSRHPYNTA